MSQKNKRKNLAIDLGNYGIKYKLEGEDANVIESRVESYSGDNYISGNVKVLEYGGKKIRSGGNFESENIKIKRNNLFDCFLLALAQVAEDGSKFRIGVGIPVAQYKHYSEELKNILYRKTIDYKYGNNKSKTISIEDIIVLPEALGTYWSLTPEEIEEFEGKDIIVIDVGGRTTDLCTIVDTEYGVETLDPMSPPYGMFTAYQEIKKNFGASKEGAGLDINLNEMRKLIKKGVVVGDNVISLSKYKHEAFSSLASKIASDVKMYNPNHNRCVVLLCGGGSEEIGKIYKEKQEFSHLVVKKSIYSNVEGFMEYLLNTDEQPVDEE